MSNHKEDLIELHRKWGLREDAARMRTEAITDRYALIPRPDMPVLDERGEASDGWWRKTCRAEGADRHRREASYCLARAEWYVAFETMEAETKLSERRNRVLDEYCERAGYAPGSRYEDLPDSNTLKLSVDMIIEAEDEAGK